MHHKRNQDRKTVQKIRKDIHKHFQPNYKLEDILNLGKLENPKPVYDKLEEFIQQNVRGITSTQLRKLFDLIPESPTKETLLMQRPQFAHMIAKQPNESAKNIMLLVDEMTITANQVGKDHLLKGVNHFLQSLVAFHKFHEVLSKRRQSTEKFIKSMESDLKIEKFKNIHLDTLLKMILELPKGRAIQDTFEVLKSFITKNAGGISNTQLRNIYDKIIKAITVQQLQELRPLLAYTAARQAGEKAIKFIYLLLSLIKKVEEKSQVKDFQHVAEMIVSFHRYQEEVNNEKIFPEKLTKSINDHFGMFYGKLLSMQTTTNYGNIQEKIQEFVLIKDKEGIKGSQFRRLFDEVMMVENVADLRLLEPLFLYTIARQSNPNAQKIILFFAELLTKMKDTQMLSFQTLMMDFMAYHRFFEETEAKFTTQLT
jgi:CRISPR/Cas system CSM-associated protein Csm2 small subunit